ncbi:MAG: hypothetical protein AAFN74_11230 [Myxococcota bacterium]
MLLKLAKWGGVAVGGLLSFDMLGKAFGSNPDFMQAYMINRMSGRGGFLKTYFADGLKSFFLGSRTMSAMASSGMMAGMPFAGALYGHPGMMGMNPYMANPAMMGALPYPGMMMGAGLWGV